MSTAVLSNRQRAEFRSWDLWVEERFDGKWQAWIDQKQPFALMGIFRSEIEAKRMVHQFAHEYLERKPNCDCPTELVWHHLDRRTAHRFGYDCYVLSDEHNLGRVRNVSTEGAFIEVPNPPSAGSRVHLSFVLDPVLKIKACGEVRRQLAGIGVGIRFLELAPSDRRIIEELANRDKSA